MEPKTIDQFTDAELAAMVRNSIYAKNARFGDGPNDCRFLLVLAVPYGKSDTVEELSEAITAFFRLVQDDDYPERDLQVYDHEAPQHYYSAKAEEFGQSSLFT
jgi:hypothetical protein